MSGKAGIWEVLGSGAAADGDIGVFVLVAIGKFFVARADLFFEGRGIIGVFKEGTDLMRGLGEGKLFFGMLGKKMGDWFVELIELKEIAVGLGGDGKAIGNADAFGAQCSHEFAE